MVEGGEDADSNDLIVCVRCETVHRYVIGCIGGIGLGHASHFLHSIHLFFLSTSHSILISLSSYADLPW